MTEVTFGTIEQAIADIAAGKAVVVVDDEDRENEGDLVFAASAATPELLAFTIRYSSGVVCAPVTEADADRLDLPPMHHTNQDSKGTAYTVSVDARDKTTTGISAAERAHTIRLLGDPDATADAFTRPGHVFPLRAVDGGVLARPGHTEAAVDLARMAGLHPAGVVAEVVNDDGTMARLPELAAFSDTHDLTLITIADLVAYRRRTERQVEREVDARVPTRHGAFRAVGYRGTVDETEHVAFVLGDVEGEDDILVRVHSECLTGDVFGSLRCDCGPQLESALEAVATEGRGVVVYLRGHEGRGIGLLHKLRAYELQDTGADTVDANLELGLPVDARDYAIGAQILLDLQIRSVRLLTNNPAKRTSLERYGVRVHDRVALPTHAHPENVRYLRTKRDRMGHEIVGLPDEIAVASAVIESAPVRERATLGAPA
ncbi:bifunctional 3,4-dihydroxy-2-butanone-4-phosphate synthase/GTP cyclohydrolase II [Cryptosporangium aurantiacum]|uniref:Riboflavin biosynthesis protein RibBA n=1 Tax=Cryptosporangium aurantiacum TaxID=134849 RepID=A0A1M7RFG2_9ACTN|nr:bifunctional 3,4-dihydroxy-2-butanone-4-phosphate synthase/GTP cyclohydrolase II [Cryptosporangium aurantiacum]SHN44980.1 3,4-dihydroxy 2-butanone 4-phosphate synthase / GTP cyclohydrolase II [Cryptosporangium aurantiacum]